MGLAGVGEGFGAAGALWSGVVGAGFGALLINPGEGGGVVEAIVVPGEDIFKSPESGNLARLEGLAIRRA